MHEPTLVSLYHCSLTRSLFFLEPRTENGEYTIVPSSRSIIYQSTVGRTGVDNTPISFFPCQSETKSKISKKKTGLVNYRTTVGKVSEKVGAGLTMSKPQGYCG